MAEDKDDPIEGIPAFLNTTTGMMEPDIQPYRSKADKRDVEAARSLTELVLNMHNHTQAFRALVDTMNSQIVDLNKSNTSNALHIAGMKELHMREPIIKVQTPKLWTFGVKMLVTLLVSFTLVLIATYFYALAAGVCNVGYYNQDGFATKAVICYIE